MIGFLPSFSAEVVIWGSLWWPCWRSEERQSASPTLAENCSQTRCLLCTYSTVLTTSQLLRWGTQPVHLPLLTLVRYASSCDTPCYSTYRPDCYMPLLHCSRNRLRHWEASARRAFYTHTHRPCLLFYSLLSHTPIWPNAQELLGWCYIFNESRVFDLPMFIFFDVNWHSSEQPVLNVVQHEGRLIHYPFTGEGLWLRSSFCRSDRL